MARNDTMRKSLYALVLPEVEAALHGTRHLARRGRTLLFMAGGGTAAAETDSELGSRGCLDLIAGFPRDAAEQTYPMRT
ncbi:MAG: hypothetical protein LBK99_14400 [Opitutaceae bacterium]|nr:hypothetical protein [Opitutaceae bacterium]